jgi:hypothetical protein
MVSTPQILLSWSPVSDTAAYRLIRIPQRTPNRGSGHPMAITAVHTPFQSVQLSIRRLRGQFHRSVGKFVVPQAKSSFRERWTDNLCHFPLFRVRNVAATVEGIRSSAVSLTTFVISLCAADEMSLPPSMRSVPRMIPSGKRTDRSVFGPIGPFLCRRHTFHLRKPLKFRSRPSRRLLAHRMP